MFPKKNRLDAEIDNLTPEPSPYLWQRSAVAQDGEAGAAARDRAQALDKGPHLLDPWTPKPNLCAHM